ncbi:MULTISPECIES: FecR domain-containing protein [unclassified Pseudomonas]|uniref:FecR domain-containing protein n=1 Tax=unclassified Pseudomonas TaxID=196821 RepID=UPI0023E434F4|nr:FecR domain-containing protein [Pseudomonas sp. D3]WET08445.1 FecR domain-containing protein [Pseudomonas sp. D3]
MTLLKKPSAIDLLLLLALVSAAPWVQAAPAAGTVIHLSGPLFVKKLDGSMRVLGEQSVVEVGDTLSTQGKGYAQVRLRDESLLTLQPRTTLSVDTFAYDVASPATDAVVFTLKQGGLRSDGGLLGKRSQDRSTLITPGGRIGLQSASVVVYYQPAAVVATHASTRLKSLAVGLASSAGHTDSSYRAFAAAVSARYAYRLANVLASAESWAEQGRASLAVFSSELPAKSPVLAPGLYVQVLDGVINITNGGGTQNFAPGQFGFTPGFTTAPVVVPKNPGMLLTSPPSFTASTPKANSGSESTDVKCEVR